MAQSHDGDPAASGQKRIGIILFNEFETLDVFGPVQMLGRLPDYRLVAITQDGTAVTSSQGLISLAHHAFLDAPHLDILLVPGGMGTRREIENLVLLDFLRARSDDADYVTSVCTGAALLAKAGILDGRNATTNKAAFDWVAGQSDKVAWQRHARWVADGKFMTSSGVSAGTDMALALVASLHDRDTAEKTAREAEYVWNDDPHKDPFAID
ncbi:DJ-1/PfpI family protein [Sphingomonas sp.]|uniref:DJ-1/PfpI family protein n=1 Tax=Sphingomonas sp. TaxID=28214 RepID=UPI003B3BDD3D